MNLDFMNLAFEYAKKAYDNNEVPVGAVIVKDGKVLSCGYNNKEGNFCSVYHAEIIAIMEATKKLNNWRLDDCDLYVTLDPCPMCASAIKQSRIKNVYSALNNSDFNNQDLINLIFKTDNVNPGVNFISNLSPDKSRILLNKFFLNRRNNE